MKSRFAPAERSSPEQVSQQASRLESATALREVLDSCANPLTVLNQERQIIFCNRALTGLVEEVDPVQLWGLRPGEAFHCVHSSETPGGCGTTEFCRTCGAVLAILEGQRNRPSVKECRISRQMNGQFEALDLSIAVSPVTLWDGYVICSISDISHEKRRRALEHIFFHDVLNLAWGMQVAADSLARAPFATGAADSAKLLASRALALMTEIKSQQQLAAAEHNELTVVPSRTSCLLLLKDTVEQYRRLPLARQRQIEIDPGSLDLTLITDPALLNRVLGNMMKNALEATAPGETVRAGCWEVDGQCEFWVHNSAVMAPEVQLQVFQRSFSTKGHERGLGTYSMKLLTERYLKGRVRFTSAPGEGTVFFARYPRAVQ